MRATFLPLACILLAPALAAATIPLPLPGDTPIERFPDSVDLRTGLFDGFYNAPRRTALAAPARVLESGERSWRQSTVATADAFYLILAARGDGSFPLHAQGTWIVKRSNADGSFLQAKVFLKSDAGTFLRIYPEDRGRSRLDVVAYGGVLNREVPLPLPFDRVLRSSMAEIIAWTEETIDWSLFSPLPGQYAELRRLASSIRARLPGLRYAEDGGIDAAGKLVFIKTGAAQGEGGGLNCSGFAQWVIDGLVKPLTGSWLPVEPLKERLLEYRGSSFTAVVEESLDPWFGMDWVRNLGRAWADARYPSRRHGPLEADVSLEPFALIAGMVPDAVNGASTYSDYPARGPDTGYEISGLASLLFVLASREPGNFYLASISALDPATGVRRHSHVALFFPWFDEASVYRVAVFESAVETSLSSFIERHTGETAFLVRAPAHDRFDPPLFP